jgi:hypothetical protein
LIQAILILIVLLSPKAWAFDVTRIDANRGYVLGQELDIWHNKGDAAPEAEVLSGKMSQLFARSQKEFPGIGFGKGELWARFTLTNSGSETVELWLESKNPLVDQISFFMPDASGHYQARHQGDKVDFIYREISYRMPSFALKVPPGTHSYYVRTITAGSNMMALVLWQTRSFDHHRWRDGILLNCMLGILLAVFSYNVFLGFSLRSRTYHLYSVFLCFMVCMQFCMAGLPAVSMDFELGTRLGNKGFLYLSNLTGMTAILVTASFLNMKQFMPRWYMVLRVLLVMTSGIMILGLFADYNTFAFTSSTFGALYCMALLAASIQAVLRGYGPARYYTLAWFFVLGATVLNSLHYQGILHPDFIVDFNSLPGAVFEGILMSLALADRVNFIRGKAEKTILKLNSELSLHIAEVEKIVAERTLTIRTILDNVPSGLLMVNREGLIMGGCSRSCQVLLNNAELEGQSFAGLLGLTGSEASIFRLSLEQVFAASLPIDVALQQIPQSVKKGSKYFQLGANAIESAEGQVQSILFTIEDVTELRSRQIQSRRHGVLIHILSDLAAFRQFVASSHESIQRLKMRLDERHKKFILHTLKGNSSVFKLHRVAKLIHKVEEQSVIGLNEVQLVEKEFETFLGRHRKLLKTDWGRVNDEVSLSLGKLKEIGAIVAADGDAALSARVQSWMEEVSQPVVGSIVGPMIASSRRTAKQLGKTVLIQLEGEDIRTVNSQETTIIESLTHLLRNSVIHGIEKEREELGKPKTGLITLTFAADETALQIRLSDDGRGLNRKTWETAAQQRLLMSAKEASALELQDLVSRVVKSDFSTQKNLTLEAGRGIGLGGFLQSIEEAHGHYILKSKEGHGFSLEIQLPRRPRERLDTAV